MYKHGCYHANQGNLQVRIGKDPHQEVCSQVRRRIHFLSSSRTYRSLHLLSSHQVELQEEWRMLEDTFCGSESNSLHEK